MKTMRRIMTMWMLVWCSAMLQGCVPAVSYAISFVHLEGQVFDTVETSGNEPIDLPDDPERSGYAFGGWYLDDGTFTQPFGSDAPTMTPIQGDLVVYAKWIPLSYSVTYDLNGGTAASSYPTTFTLEDALVLEDPEKTGHVFSGWFLDEAETIAFDPETMVPGNLVLHASWTIASFTITFVDRDETVQTIHADFGTSLADLVPPDVDAPEGYRFLGWTPALPETMPASDLVLYAQFELYLEYLLEGDEITITGVIDAGIESIEIPESIDGHPVTAIADGAFANLDALKRIVLPETIASIGLEILTGASSLDTIVTPFLGSSRSGIGVESVLGYFFGFSPYPGSYLANSFELPASLREVTLTDVAVLGDSAFYGAISLTSIVLPDGLTDIGAGAFIGASGLTSLVLPESVLRIGNGAFANADGIEAIAIPQAVTAIAPDAFDDMDSLLSIEVSADNSIYRDDDGVLYSKDGQVLVRYPSGRPDESFTIPEGVIGIGSHAFAYASGLRTVSIPPSVHGIYDYAFYHAVGLTSLVLPDGLTHIGDHAFACASGIIALVIPDAVVSIGGGALAGMSSLASLTLPFVGQSRSAVGSHGVFGHLFDSVDFDGGYPAYGGNLPISLIEVVITDASKLADYAFSGASSLISIYIPASVETIGYLAFQGAENVTIFAGAASLPSGWNGSWNPDDRPVVWNSTSTSFSH